MRQARSTTLSFGTRSHLISGLLTFAAIPTILSGCSNASEQTPRAIAPVEVAAQEDDQSPKVSQGIYQAKVYGSTRLYPSVDSAEKFLNSDLDTMHAMVKRGYFNDIPMLEEGETVTASVDTTGKFRFVQTADGKKGYISSSLLPKSPDEIQKLNSESPSVSVFNASLKEFGPPRELDQSKQLSASGLQLKLQGIEFKSIIGNKEGDGAWAEADEGYRFAVVSYTMTNASKEDQYLPMFSVLLDSNGQAYPRHDNGTFALWEQKKFQEPEMGIKPGKTLKVWEVFYIPQAVATGTLYFSAPDNVPNSKYQYKIALGEH